MGGKTLQKRTIQLYLTDLESQVQSIFACLEQVGLARSKNCFQ